MAKRKGEISRAYVKQEDQGLKAFAFCVVTVDNEPTKPRFKRKIRG